MLWAPALTEQPKGARDLPVGEDFGTNAEAERHREHLNARSHLLSMDRDSQSEDTLSTMVLENIKSKLIHAFRAAGESSADRRESAASVRPLSIGRDLQANEELRRAQIDGALTWLRTELVSWFKVGFLGLCACLSPAKC